MVNLGIIAEDSTTRFYMSTSISTGAATDMSASLEQADFVIMKDGAAMTLDALSIIPTNITTGIYEIDIDTSVDADFTKGSTYWVYFAPSDETLDSVDVAAVLGCFSIETAAQQAKRLFDDSVYPLGATIATTTGNTTGRILLTDLLDAQTADASLVGANLTVWDATNGQVEHVTIVSVESARLFNVVCTSDGAVMDFTVAAGDRVWFTGFSALRATVPARTLDVTATGAGGVDWGNVENATTVVVLSGTTMHGVIKGTAATGTLSTTVATSDLSGYANDELNGRVIIFTGGTAEGQAAAITDYASSSGTVTFSGGIATAPANGDSFIIV